MASDKSTIVFSCEYFPPSLSFLCSMYVALGELVSIISAINTCTQGYCLDSLTIYLSLYCTYILLTYRNYYQLLCNAEINTISQASAVTRLTTPLINTLRLVPHLVICELWDEWHRHDTNCLYRFQTSLNNINLALTLPCLEPPPPEFRVLTVAQMWRTVNALLQTSHIPYLL